MGRDNFILLGVGTSVVSCVVVLGGWAKKRWGGGASCKRRDQVVEPCIKKIKGREKEKI